MKYLDNVTGTIPLLEGRSYNVMVTGTFGGGTLALTLIDAEGGRLAMPDYGALTSPDGFVFASPAVALEVVLSGATTPDVNIFCTQVPA